MSKYLEAYLKKHTYPPELYDVIRGIEKEKPFYLLANDKMIDAVRDCCFKDIDSLYEFVDIVNKYCESYEKDILAIPIGKRLIISRDVAIRLLAKDRVNARRLITRDEMLYFIREIQQASYKFMCLGCYEGIGSGQMYMDDLTLTNASGINSETNEITLYSGKTFKYSKELIELAIEASKENRFVDAIGRTYETVANGKIVRPKASLLTSITPESSYKRFAVWISKYRIAHPEFNKFKLPEIQNSGFINSVTDRIGKKKYAKEDRELIKDILEKYNKSNMLDSSIIDAFNKYRRVI